MKRPLFPLPLSNRLLITFVTLIALGLGSLIAVTGTRLAQQTTVQAEQALLLQAQTIANGLRDPFQRSSAGQPLEGRSLDALVQSFGQGVNARVTLLDANRKVLLSSDQHVSSDGEEDEPEFKSHDNEHESPVIRPDSTTNQERLFVAAPVVGDRAQVLGYVQLSTPLAPIQAEIRNTWLNLFAIGAIVLFAAGLASLLLAHQIVAPVEHLTATSEKIAAGQLNERVTPAGPREVRTLGMAFNTMAERVQEMLARQRSFVDNAAHELRTPLTALSLRLELLQTKGQNDPALVRDYTSQMARQVTALRRTVDHLLALASAEATTKAPRRSLDLAPLLYDLADEMGTVAQQAGLTLNVDVPDHLPCVMANAEQMNIALRNLIDNAIKYTPKDGTVTLSAGADTNHVEVRVADTGIGIPAKAQPHIFERFYRVEQPREGTSASGEANEVHPQGAGLGLALVRAIAESHGGGVSVTSRVDQGSEFVMTLPVEPS